MTVESLTSEISTIDQWGFQYKHDYHWLPETLEDEAARLHYNLCLYKIGIGFGKRYPAETTKSRMIEFTRLGFLKESHPGIAPETKVFDETLREVLRNEI